MGWSCQHPPAWDGAPRAPFFMRMNSCDWPQREVLEDDGPAPDNQVFNPFLGGQAERQPHRESFDFMELKAGNLLENCGGDLHEPFNEYQIDELLLERPTN